MASVSLHRWTNRAASQLAMEPPLAGALAAVVGIGLFWILLIWAQLYIFPVMTVRDCGWLRAYQVSLDLAGLEKRDSFLRALIATGLSLTIFGIPAAMALLLQGIGPRDLLISSILEEKTRQEIDRVLSEEERESPRLLDRYFDLLERGRYLDALNGFQMQLMKDPEFVPALRGASLALLKMGNPQARETLERWEKLDPDSQEVAGLLLQREEGRWAEGGDLYEQAQRECTQEIGRGVL